MQSIAIHRVWWASGIDGKKYRLVRRCSLRGLVGHGVAMYGIPPFYLFHHQDDGSLKQATSTDKYDEKNFDFIGALLLLCKC